MLKQTALLWTLLALGACSADDSDGKDAPAGGDTDAGSGTDSDTDGGTDSDTDGGTDTDTDPPRSCDDVVVATLAMATAGSLDTDGGHYLVCSEPDSSGSCVDHPDLPYTFVDDNLGNPWGDPYCWYSAWAVCGPETAEPDQCCYEFVFDGVVCA